MAPKRLLLLLQLAFFSVEAGAQFSAFIISGDAFCGLNSGHAAVYHSSVSGATYSYQWSNGATTQAIVDLAPGDYSVTITDQLGVFQEVSVTIAMASQQPIDATWMVSCEPGSCDGMVYVSAATGLTAQPMTYAVDPPQCVFAEPDNTFAPFMPGVFVPNLQGGSTYTITVTDANGCSGSTTGSIDSLWFEPWEYTVDQIVPSCGTEDNGSFVLTPPGEYGSWRLEGPNGFEDLYFWDMQPPYIFADLAPGTYTVRRRMGADAGWEAYFGWYCEGIEVVIPSLPEPCAGISGRITHDADEDCIIGQWDLALPYRVLTIEPGPQYAFTGINGTYWKDLPDGNYTIGQSLTDEDQVCPPNAQEPFTVDAGSPLAIVDFFNLSTVPHDISVWMVGTAPQVGFPTQVNIWVRNNSAFYSGDVTLDFTYDEPLLSPSFSGPQDLGVIPPHGMIGIQFTAQVPPNVDLLDTQVIYTATVTNTVAEQNTDNNSAISALPIVGAYDPNDKLGQTSSGASSSLYFLDQDEWINYTVRFQNTGSAAAQTVVIRDEIDTDLRIPSIEIMGASHAFTPSFGEGRELVFTFNDIDLPDSTTDFLGSQGSISYRIKPNSTIALGDVIENTAAIYFDFNPPIITNTVEHLVDLSTRVNEVSRRTLWVAPNPANDILYVTLPENTGTALQVLAVDGRTVSVPIARRPNSLELDVRSLTPGVYTVRTDTGTARFLKQ